MEKIILCVLSLSLSGAVSGALILLIRPATRKIFSKRWNYYIWLLVAIRLLVPVYMENSYSLTLSEYMGSQRRPLPFEITQKDGDREGESGERDGILEAELGKEDTLQGTDFGKEAGIWEAGLEKEDIRQRTELEEAASKPVQKMESSQMDKPQARKWRGAFWGMIWILGAGISFCVKIKNYCHYTKYITENREKICDQQIYHAADVLCRKLAMKKRPEIYECGGISGPITIGLLRPVIVLSKEGERNLDTLSLVLHHELVHVKRKDLWYKWLYQILLSIHWFNPILYLVERKMNIDCELSCDEKVLAALTQEGKKAYGNVLLDAAEQNMGAFGKIPSPTLFNGKEELKVRLKGILQYKKQSGFRVFISLCISTGIMFLTACGSVQVSQEAMPVHLSGLWSDEGDYNWDNAADEYTSFWDNAANEYTSFWDRAAMAVGNMMNGGPDDFLSSPVLDDKSDIAWQVYDDDSLLAGEDITGQWHMYNYYGGKRLNCSGMYLSGGTSVLIAYAKSDGIYQVHSAFEGLSGRFKIVHIGPDGEVTVINETGEEDKIDVTFKAGRNVIKLVGQGAKIRNLKVEYSDLNDRNFEGIYYTQEEEQSAVLTAEIKMGIVDKDKVMECLYYLDDETVSEAVALLLEQKIPISEEEMEKLLIYSDSELTSAALVKVMKEGDIAPLSNEMVMKICPYLDDDALAELLAAMGDSLTDELIYQCVPYLRDDRLKEVLLSMGERLTGEIAYQCAPYLENAELTEVLLSIGERLTAKQVYQCAPYLGKSGLKDVLLSMDERMTFDLLHQCAPYLGSDNLESCLKKYLEDGNEISYSEYSKISPYVGEKAIERLEKIKPQTSLSE